MRFIGFALAAFSLLLVVGAVSRLDQSRGSFSSPLSSLAQKKVSSYAEKIPAYLILPAINLPIADLSNNKYRLARGLVVLARQDDTTEIVPTETAVIIETEVPEPTGTGLSTTEIDP